MATFHLTSLIQIKVENDGQNTNHKFEGLIHSRPLGADAATSYMHDSNYSHRAIRNLLKAVRAYYIEIEYATSEVRHLVSSEDEELSDLMRGNPVSIVERAALRRKVPVSRFSRSNSMK